MKLKDIVKDEGLCNLLNINRFCINERANPEEYREVEVKSIEHY